MKFYTISKRFLSLFAAAVMISTALIPVSAVEYGAEYKDKPSGTYNVKFYDVPRSYWAFDFIGEMQKRGVLNGYPNGHYYPDNYVERCEFAKIMVGAAGLRLEDPEYSYFCDVKHSDWFYSYVETAKDYLTGYKSFGQNYFRPSNYALREDIAVALVKLKGYDTKSADQNMLKTMFSDYESISESAKPYVAAAIERGLVSGYEDGTFRGQDSISRAEAAAMLWRAFQYGNDNKTADVSKSDDAQKTTEITKNDNKTSETEKSQDDKKSTDTKNNENNNSKNDEKQSDNTKQSKKTYAVKTLAKATIDDSLTDFTVDGNDNVYYINRSDNSLYRVSSKGGSAKKIISLSKLKYQETETREETVEVKTKVEKPSDTSDASDTSDNADTPKPSDESQNESISESASASAADDNDTEGSASTPPEDKNNTNDNDSEDEYIYETKTVEKEVVVAQYSDFSAQQVYYDKTSDKVWLVGYFNNKINEDGQEGEGNFWITLNADDLNEVITKYEFTEYGYQKIIGSLPNSQVAVASTYSWYPDLVNPITEMCSSFHNSEYDYEPISAMQSGNKLYLFGGRYDRLYTYDFSSQKSSEFETEFSIKADKTACGNNSFYFWDITNGKITAFSPKTEKFRTLDIDTINDVELSDGGYISANGNKVMKVTSNESFVFADKDAGAIRILYKK